MIIRGRSRHIAPSRRPSSSVATPASHCLRVVRASQAATCDEQRDADRSGADGVVRSRRTEFRGFEQARNEEQARPRVAARRLAQQSLSPHLPSPSMSLGDPLVLRHISNATRQRLDHSEVEGRAGAGVLIGAEMSTRSPEGGQPGPWQAPTVDDPVLTALGSVVPAVPTVDANANRPCAGLPAERRCLPLTLRLRVDVS